MSATPDPSQGPRLARRTASRLQEESEGLGRARRWWPPATPNPRPQSEVSGRVYFSSLVPSSSFCLHVTGDCRGLSARRKKKCLKKPSRASAALPASGGWLPPVPGNTCWISKKSISALCHFNLFLRTCFVGVVFDVIEL